jgi:hypothetical protein
MYEGRGIGMELLYKLFDHLSTKTKSFNHLIRDSSFGWAFIRALPMLRARMSQLGYESYEIASGKIGFHGGMHQDPCKLIHYIRD